MSGSRMSAAPVHSPIGALEKWEEFSDRTIAPCVTRICFWVAGKRYWFRFTVGAIGLIMIFLPFAIVWFLPEFIGFAGFDPHQPLKPIIAGTLCGACLLSMFFGMLFFGAAVKNKKGEGENVS